MTTNYTPMGSKAEVRGDDDAIDLHDFARPSRKTPKIIFALLVILLILVTVLSVTFIVLYVRRDRSSSDGSTPSSSPGSDICQSDACFDLSVQIKGSMNEDVDPCEDFYNFTCGNWPIYNHITQGILPLLMSHVLP